MAGVQECRSISLRHRVWEESMPYAICNLSFVISTGVLTNVDS